MQLYILDTLAFYGICTGKLLVVTVYVMISTARDNRGTKMGELEILVCPPTLDVYIYIHIRQLLPFLDLWYHRLSSCCYTSTPHTWRLTARKCLQQQQQHQHQRQ